MIRTLTAARLAALIGRFDRAPAYRGLRLALQELIGDGRIPLETRLPSERAISEVLDVSRNTVTRAYADLVGAGYAVARQGSGTYAAVPVDRRGVHDHALHSTRRPGTPAIDIELKRAASAATPGVSAAFERALAALPAYLSTDGYLPSGLPLLQERVAASYARRGLPTAPEQIVVTAGALAAIAIVARAFSRPGDRVMIESPTYPNAINALRLGGGQLVSAPLGDPLGEAAWDLDAIDAALRETAPRLAYVNPDFQNPTGLLMRDAERARYAAALRAAGTIAIVDEALHATHAPGVAMPAPFATHATNAISIGSVSKLYWGGLRVGWIRAPREVVGDILAARVQADLGSSLFDQLVVAELLDDEDVAARRREQLHARRLTLAHAIAERLPEWRFRLPDGGLALWLRLPHGSASDVSARTERLGVSLAPGPVFSVEGGSDRWLRVSCAKPREQLLRATERIAQAWSGMPAKRASPRKSPRPLIV